MAAISSASGAQCRERFARCHVECFSTSFLRPHLRTRFRPALRCDSMLPPLFPVYPANEVKQPAVAYAQKNENDGEKSR